jgi:hypothetical protein
MNDRRTMTIEDLGTQLGWLLFIALVTASITWTVTHEEIFREFREYCTDRSRTCRTLVARKVFYIFTCEYCFSHYVALGVLLMTGFHLLLPGWRGLVLALFATTAVANVYMSAFARLRLDVKAERLHTEAAEREIHGAAPPRPARRA